MIAARSGTTVNAMECRLDEEVVLEKIRQERLQAAKSDDPAAAVTVSF